MARIQRPLLYDKDALLPAAMFCEALLTRVKSDSFTCDFKEYVGIDEWTERCDFEIDVQGELHQAPKVSISDSFYI